MAIPASSYSLKNLIMALENIAGGMDHDDVQVLIDVALPRGSLSNVNVPEISLITTATAAGRSHRLIITPHISYPQYD